MSVEDLLPISFNAKTCNVSVDNEYSPELYVEVTLREGDLSYTIVEAAIEFFSTEAITELRDKLTGILRNRRRS